MKSQFLAGFLLLLSVTALADTRLEFDVYLDDSQIGSHEFLFSGDTDDLKVTSRASFKVKFLFVTAFDYKHEANETWTDGCLTSIRSKTRANGKRMEVSGESESNEFLVRNGDSELALSDCVMSFAYWNPSFLEQPGLLNAQSGEYLEISVEELGSANRIVNGQEVNAVAYRLTARDTDITVWYSDDKQWLALETIAKGGKKLRYELS